MSTPSASALLYAATVASPSSTASRPDNEITKTKAWHVKSGGFQNPWESFATPSTWFILKSMLGRRLRGESNKPDVTPPTVPIRKAEFLSSRQSSDKLRATWLGHACYLVEFPSGLRVLFDPVFEDICSPLPAAFGFLAPKRYTPTPCDLADIPTIDAVVISHNHYDHLSHPTVTRLAKLHPNIHFFVPLGNKKWFEKCNIKNCTELDWWEEVDVTFTPQAEGAKKVSLTSTDEPNPSSPGAITARFGSLPCQHMTARSINDRFATLWSSWSVKSGGKSVWFGGDTGYRSVPSDSHGKDDWGEEYSHLPHCPAFADIGKLRGPFDLGLIPIGAYSPRFIMSPMHANPRDSVEIFRDTKCQRALGMHWGTWVLTEEDVLEPPKLLKKALKHHDIPEEGVFDVVDIGESREF